MRLRQLVIAAKDGPHVASQLRNVLGLGEPYADPGVAEFGLDNAVFAIGDQFLEVIWPIAETAPATRFLARNGGDGGYMVILQTGDIAAQRKRAETQSIRSVWNVDLPDISATHFHPADTGGAILSVDTPIPAASWRWGGPDWKSRATPGKLTEAVFHTADPDGLTARWSALLKVKATGHWLQLSDASLTFVPDDTDKLTAFGVAVTDPAAALARAQSENLSVSGESVTIGGVRLDLSQL